MENFDAKEIVKRYRTGGISRREMGRLMGMLGIAGLGSWAVPGKAAAADKAMIFGWAGYDDENLWPTYVEKYGELPRFTFWGDEEEGVTKLVTGFEPDIVFPCSYKIAKWWSTGRLAHIDTSRLKNWDDILPSLRSMTGVMQDGGVAWVPVDWGLTSVVYRPDLAPEYVNNHSWEILWDPKYQGRTACFDSLVDCVTIAGTMAGVKNPFDYRDPADLEATRERMQSLVSNLLYFSNDSTSLEQGIASGELVAATVWNESIVRLKDQGVNVEYMRPKEGGPQTWVCGLAMIKDSAFEDQAYELIDAMLEPSSRAYEITAFGYGVSTQGGYDLVDEETLAALGMTKNPDADLARGTFQEEIQNEEGLQAMFDEVKAGI